MNYKITCHLMPWELDYALLSFTQLKKSKYYLNDNDKIYVDVTLNLSSYLINWGNSKIPKEFFIEKFESLQPLLKDYICRFKIYDGDKLYGGLNTQRESTEDHIDFYSVLNPDMYFNETLLSYLIESSKIIKNKFFIITPQIPKCWDLTWDVISNKHYLDVKYEDWNNLDAYDIRYFLKNNNEEISLSSINDFKFAGWFDIYSKEFWNNFFVGFDDWNGYGACDLYAITLSHFAKTQNLDIQQYVLENQIVCEYEIGPLKYNNLSKYYKDMLVLNDIPNQREQFDAKINEYLNKGIKQLKEKNII